MDIMEIYKTLLKTKKYPLYLRILVIISHWVFQGMLYMDTTERMFKLLFDISLSVVGTYLISQSLSLFHSILLSLLIAHTLNWIFNSNLMALFRSFGLVSMSRQDLELYLRRIKQKAQKEDFIICLGIYGSLARGEFKETSDLDIRVIRKPGVITGIRACIFVMKERTWATLNRFPLDIYVLDSSRSLDKKIRKDELQKKFLFLGGGRNHIY